MRLILATGNRHKLDEIRAILPTDGLTLDGLDTLPGMPAIIEDGDTFAANAVKKAVITAQYAGTWALADDSGIEVIALDGAPGLRSARYAGEPCDDRANNHKLLRELDGNPDRRARFRCAIALAAPDGRAETVEGLCNGSVLTAARGTGGFGYDPLFLPDGYSVTFAELDPAVKNRISHRARALEAARTRWWPDGRFRFQPRATP